MARGPRAVARSSASRDATPRTPLAAIRVMPTAVREAVSQGAPATSRAIAVTVQHAETADGLAELPSRVVEPSAGVATSADRVIALTAAHAHTTYRTPRVTSRPIAPAFQLARVTALTFANGTLTASNCLFHSHLQAHVSRVLPPRVVKVGSATRNAGSATRNAGAASRDAGRAVRNVAATSAMRDAPRATGGREAATAGAEARTAGRRPAAGGAQGCDGADGGRIPAAMNGGRQRQRLSPMSPVNGVTYVSGCSSAARGAGLRHERPQDRVDA